MRLHSPGLFHVSYLPHRRNCTHVHCTRLFIRYSCKIFDVFIFPAVAVHSITMLGQLFVLSSVWVAHL